MKFLRAAMIALAALNLIDMGITALLLTQSRAVAEANWLMRALWSASPALFVAVKIFLSAVFVCVARRVDGSRRWMVFAIVPTTAVYCAVVGWSIFVLANAA